MERSIHSLCLAPSVRDLLLDAGFRNVADILESSPVQLAKGRARVAESMRVVLIASQTRSSLVQHAVAQLVATHIVCAGEGAVNTLTRSPSIHCTARACSECRAEAVPREGSASAQGGAAGRLCVRFVPPLTDTVPHLAPIRRRPRRAMRTPGRALHNSTQLPSRQHTATPTRAKTRNTAIRSPNSQGAGWIRSQQRCQRLGGQLCQQLRQ